MQNIQGVKPKTKICFVVTKGVWGGAQKYVYTLSTSLPKNNFEAIVVSGEGEILPNKLKDDGIKTYKLSELVRDISFVGEIKSFFSLLKILKTEKPDVLHLNSPKAGGLGALAGRIYNLLKIGNCDQIFNDSKEYKNGSTPVVKLKIVYIAHGWPFNEDRSKFKKFLIFGFSWMTVFLSHKTIVIAEKELKQGRKMPFVKNKLVLIRNGVSQFGTLEKNIARKKLLELCGHQVSTDLNALLWLGTISELHKNKGLGYVIESLANIKIPFVFFIIGGGEEKNNLENLIKKYNLEKKVFLTGFQDNANQYLNAFDIFTLTSIKEGLPYTILEAGLAGLPVIASSVGGIPDIIDNKINGILVEKTNVKQITEAIEFMIENPIERKTMGMKLQQKIEKDFSQKQMMEKTIEVYKVEIVDN